MLTICLTAIFFVTFMWLFNTEFVVHDWAKTTGDLPKFVAIVGTLIVVVLIIVYFMMKPLISYLRITTDGQDINEIKRTKAVKALVNLPRIIIILNIIGFLIGPTISLATPARSEKATTSPRKKKTP